MHRRIAANGKWCAALFIRYANSSLPLYYGQIPFDRLLQSRFIEHHRMQRLRKTADLVECTLRDFANFEQFCAKRRSIRSQIAGTAKHRSHGGKNLSKLIVQLA